MGSLWLLEEEALVEYLWRLEVVDLVGSPSFQEETPELLGVEARVGNPEDLERSLELQAEGDQVGNLWIQERVDLVGSPWVQEVAVPAGSLWHPVGNL